MPAESRVALVTGGSKGIGRAVVERLARGGWRVLSADRAPPPAGHPARHVARDLDEEAAVKALVAGIAREEGRLDALVSNAGFMIRKPIRELTLAEWSSVLATNLTATFLLVREAQAMLRAAVRAGYGELLRLQGRPRRADACAGHQPRP